MNVSGVSSNNAVAQNHQQSSAVASLQKAKQQLQAQIHQIQNNSKMDAKTKQGKIKELNEQIQQIDLQITQVQAEERQRKAEEAQEKAMAAAQQKNQSQGSETTGAVLSPHLKGLLNASTRLKEASGIHKVKTELEGKINIANAEMKNSTVGASNQSQMNTIGTASEQLTQLNFDMGRKLGETQRDLKKVTKDNIKKAEQSRTQKNRSAQRDAASTSSDNAASAETNAAATALEGSSNPENETVSSGRDQRTEKVNVLA